VAAENGASLRLSEQMAMSGQSSVLGRELLRLEHRTLEMLNEANDDPQALSEKLAWLEANVAELKRAGERLEGVAAALPSTTPTGAGGDLAPTTAKAATFPLVPASSPPTADLPSTSPAAAVQTGGLAAAPDLRQKLAAAALAALRPPSNWPRSCLLSAASAAPPRRSRNTWRPSRRNRCGRGSGCCRSTSINDMRDEFEAMTLKLNRNFNVEIIRWDGGEARQDLELVPLDGYRWQGDDSGRDTAHSRPDHLALGKTGVYRLSGKAAARQPRGTTPRFQLAGSRGSPVPD
jgi:hypothetical protein